MAIKRTIDHDEIRRVVEEHGGKPSVVIGTTDEEGEGVLALDFNDPLPNSNIIGWQEFFDIFEKNKLRFHYESSSVEDVSEWEYGFEGRDEPMDVDEDETLLPEDVDDVDENMFPSSSESPGETNL